MNLNHWACCHYYTCFVFVNNLSVRAEPTFDLIYTICESFSKIL